LNGSQPPLPVVPPHPHGGEPLAQAVRRAGPLLAAGSLDARRARGGGSRLAPRLGCAAWGHRREPAAVSAPPPATLPSLRRTIGRRPRPPQPTLRPAHPPHSSPSSPC